MSIVFHQIRCYARRSGRLARFPLSSDEQRTESLTEYVSNLNEFALRQKEAREKAIAATQGTKPGHLSIDELKKYLSEVEKLKRGVLTLSNAPLYTKMYQSMKPHVDDKGNISLSLKDQESSVETAESAPSKGKVNKKKDKNTGPVVLVSPSMSQDLILKPGDKMPNIVVHANTADPIVLKDEEYPEWLWNMVTPPGNPARPVLSNILDSQVRTRKERRALNALKMQSNNISK